ncbi:MAG TPA: cation-translocating P-type ATPase C-terminal domain-containing protein [Noviherbaspirillum sp.]|jgi:magnesium-transporting ATPase (P-type)|uniref:cation-translocating P-type ATPase C-terminal domain-containing protein n=1 Tax=Noviherbaspirillum sp. TaxID=1926288 RepID=UPI002DDCA61C|nr:cation-translocating P-type ATPase C-terminal domain-containing protein [Noviherbaspirillum sp.]HEV2609832.1 cation-translocating P-type ATPase C-terminal domain-containing protein [Noviherbaspirillum sp.]
MICSTPAKRRRSDRDSIFSQGLRSNLPLLGAVLPTFLLQMATVYVPALNPIFDTQPLTAPNCCSAWNYRAWCFCL